MPMEFLLLFEGYGYNQNQFSDFELRSSFVYKASLTNFYFESYEQQFYQRKLHR